MNTLLSFLQKPKGLFLRFLILTFYDNLNTKISIKSSHVIIGFKMCLEPLMFVIVVVFVISFFFCRYQSLFIFQIFKNTMD